MKSVLHFKLVDYIVSIGATILPLVVGIYYFFTHEVSRESFLFGDRKANVFAVSVSIAASSFIGVALIG